MHFLHARRLTGRNPLMPGTGAAVEHLFDAGDDRGAHAAAWEAVLGPALAEVGLGHVGRYRREHAAGVSLGVDGVIDRLYAEVDLVEWASEVMCGTATLTRNQAVARFHEQAAAEANPALVALQAAARARGAPLLWDDEQVTLGWGRGALTWPARALPAVDAVDWAAVGRVPVGLVTGTNGKTTTTRMATRILKHAGHVVGTTSTDAISVDERVVEAGDWTGPGAARQVLRRPEVTAAVLETARGGILRRGLAVDEVDAAIVTNVAEDHFGDWGIDTLPAMAAAKAVVWQAVRAGGLCLVHADDPVLMAATGARDAARWVLLSHVPERPEIVAHRAAGGRAWLVRDGDLVVCEGASERVVVRVADVPATFGGHARHNVDNALCAAALAHALGADDRAVRAGLTSFGTSPDDNPGRLELHTLGDLRLVLDFSHNPHGVRAVRPALEHLVASAPGARLSICFGQAGDRSDADLVALAREVRACGPGVVWLRALPGYERGRAPGETAELLAHALADLGMPATDIHIVSGEVEALEGAVAWARPGDLLVHFVHIEREAIRAWLAGRVRT